MGLFSPIEPSQAAKEVFVESMHSFLVLEQKTKSLED